MFLSKLRLLKIIQKKNKMQLKSEYQQISNGKNLITLTIVKAFLLAAAVSCKKWKAPRVKASIDLF